MRLAEFDGDKFTRDVIDWVDSERFGSQKILKNTGIATGTLNRMVKHGHEVKDISTIISICAYTGLSIKDYVVVSR